MWNSNNIRYLVISASQSDLNSPGEARNTPIVSSAERSNSSTEVSLI